MGVAVNTVTTRILADLHSDSYANLVWWSQSELTQFVDQCLKRLASVTLLLVTRSTSITLATSTATYTLPTRHIATLRVTANGSTITPTSLHELSLLDATPEDTTGATSRWYQDKITLDKIGVYKVPTATQNGHVLALTYAEWHATLDHSANTTIAMPGVIVDYLEAGALRDALGKESDAAMPEVAQHLQEHTSMLDSVFSEYWGALR